MGACLWIATLILGPLFGMGRLRYAALLVLVAVGAVSYFGAGSAIGAFRLADFRSALRRQR